MSTEHTFREGFYGEGEGLDGSANDALPTPTDQAVGVVISIWRVWPVASVTYLSKNRVGNREGCNVVDVEFIFDRPVTEWTVRVNSWSHLDGTEVARWSGVAAQVEEAVEITDADLLQGANQVAIYGRGTNGMWTPPVRVPT